MCIEVSICPVIILILILILILLPIFLRPEYLDCFGALGGRNLMVLPTVASALVFVEKRRLIEIIPEAFIKFVTELEVRVLILLSVTLQILLITLGNRRKYVHRIWIRVTLWSAYLSADWVAILALGIISKNTLIYTDNNVRNVEDPFNQLMWFWAQFFLLHLGGPDTITAYSLEDNELWLRHLVGVVIRTGVAFYILLVAFPGSSWFPILNIFIFTCGLIKYGERVLALRAANAENFRDSMLPEPDPGPNYAKFMGEYTLKRAEGFYVEAAEVIEIAIPTPHSFPDDSGKLIPEAYNLFLTFKCLFADAILSFQDRDNSLSYFRKLSPKQAFDVVEVELGFVFDELYTKASIVYKTGGFLFRVITISFSLFSLMAFIFLCDKSKYRYIDLVITYLLLVVAISLELYSLGVVINSDWAHNWLSSRREGTRSSPIIRWFQQTNKRRWSNKIAQHNLLDICLREKGGVFLRLEKFPRSIGKLIRIDRYLENHWNKTFVDVSLDLKELVFNELDRYTRNNNTHDPLSLWDIRASSFTLEKYARLSRDWSEEEEFDKRILLWHVATDICYTLEWGEDEYYNQEHSIERKKISDHSKHISNYMMYLLMVCPFMLPIGIGMIRFHDTCAEAKEFLEEIKCSKSGACKKLLRVNTEVPPGKVKGDRSKSVLFDACKLAKCLMVEEKEEKWKIISEVWVEMLACAATRCRGNHHARQLRKGGELLTHVWLLMAHLGITEQLQISQGHARAKLVVK